MTEEQDSKNIFQDKSGVLGVNTDQSRYKQEDETVDPTDDEIVNFCRDCQKVVMLKRKRRKNHCELCDGRAIFIGTKRGIKHHFRLKRLDYANDQDSVKEKSDAEA